MKSSTAVFVFLTLVGCASARERTAARPVSASLVLPNTAPARHFAAFIAAYNTRRWEPLSRFVEQHLSPQLLERLGGAQSAAGLWGSVMLTYGPATPVAIQRSTASTVNVLTYAPITR